MHFFPDVICSNKRASDSRFLLLHTENKNLHKEFMYSIQSVFGEANFESET